jgi:4-amino-4-deoxy-L-arabinose transferase-like glycosyltransferase
MSSPNPKVLSPDRTSTARRSTVTWPWLAPVSIVLLGLFLRLYRLNDQSLWDDEVFSVLASRLPISQMHPILVKDVVHPPLHYYVLHFWLALGGSPSVQSRLLSVIFGTLAIVVIYLLAKYLLDERTARLSTLLLAVSQISIQFSQEARPYAQVLFLSLCSSYLFIRALRERSTLFWWLAISSILLMVQTHYFGFFLLPCLVTFAVVTRKEHRIPGSWWIGGAALIFCACAVWFASGVLREVLYGPKVAANLGHSFSDRWYAPFELVAIFNNGRADGIAAPVVAWSYLLGGLVFLVPAIMALRPLVWRREGDAPSRLRDNTAFLLLLCAVPAVLAIVAGRIIRFYDARYIAYCAAPYYVLVARGWSQIKFASVRLALVGVGLLYSIYALRAAYFIPYKQNYRDAMAYVSNHSMPGDCYAYENNSPLLRGTELKRAWEFFQPGRPEMKLQTVASVVTMPCQRVWFVTTWLGQNPVLVAAVQKAKQPLESTFARMEEHSYYRVGVSLYERKDHGPIGIAGNPRARSAETRQ